MGCGVPRCHQLMILLRTQQRELTETTLRLDAHHLQHPLPLLAEAFYRAGLPQVTVYSKHPISWPCCSSTCSVRSTFAPPLLMGREVIVTSLCVNTSLVRFCRTNITWKRGLRPITWTGRSASTRCSKGRS